MTQGQPLGVVVAPQALISATLQRQVDLVLAEVPTDQQFAVVGIATTKGVNLAVAYKVGSTFQVGAWVGKSGWEQPIDGGVYVKYTR